MKYDTLVFVGRFQPFHNGHKAVIEKALKLTDRLIVIIGSPDKARDIKNPFTFNERKDMIEAVFPQNVGLYWRDKLIIVDSVPDYLYNEDRWLKEIQEAVAFHLPDNCKNPKVGIIGYSKDRSSYYIKRFPQWELVEADLVKPLDATMIRELYFKYGMSTTIKNFLPAEVVRNLIQFSDTPYYKNLAEEFAMVQDYKKSWDNAPYPPTFVTVDGVVTCLGHILMVKRKFAPGKGLWALPGGFLNQGESLIESTIREIKEETSIELNGGVLKGNIKESKVFDHPERSIRGRTITHASHIPLEFHYLPSVKGDDDAEKARWISFSEICEIKDQIFEDHAEIINYFTSI